MRGSWGLCVRRLVGVWAFFLALSLAGEVEGKSPGDLSVVVMAAVEDMSSRDELGSPMLYRGVGFPLIFGVEYRRGVWVVSVEGGGFYSGVNGGRLESAQGTQEGHWASSAAVDLHIQVDRVVVQSGGHRLRAGARVNHWTLYRDYHYDPSQIGSVETWDAPVTLDLVAGLSRVFLKRLEVGLWAALPLGGWVMRPHYSVRGDERVDIVHNRLLLLREGHLATWDRLQMLTARLELRWSVNARFALVGQLMASFFAFHDEVSTKALRQRGTMGVRWSF